MHACRDVSVGACTCMHACECGSVCVHACRDVSVGACVQGCECGCMRACECGSVCVHACRDVSVGACVWHICVYYSIILSQRAHIDLVCSSSQVLALVRNSKIPRSGPWLLSATRFLFLHAFFSIKEPTPDIPEVYMLVCTLHFIITK